MALEPGSVAGPFRIVAQLGQGGMASVYRAHDELLDRDVALKVLPREFLHDPGFVKRFEQEAQSIAKLEHPNIVPIYSYGIDEAEGIPWMAMRLVGGGSLKDILKRGRPPFARSIAILRSVADALDYAHAHPKRIVHRDVKPPNVLLDESGRVYLADFGIAKMLEAKEGLTATGMITGTPHYMAPEQATGLKVDARADTYALGIMAYEMFTGRVPFSADTPVAILMKHVQEPLPLPPHGTVPEALMRAVLRGTAKKPEERWATSGEFVAALEKGLAAGERTASIGDAPTVAVSPPSRPTLDGRAATTPSKATDVARARTGAAAAPVPEPAGRGVSLPVALGLALGGVAILVAAGITAVLLMRRAPPAEPSPAVTAESRVTTAGPSSAPPAPAAERTSRESPIESKPSAPAASARPVPAPAPASARPATPTPGAPAAATASVGAANAPAPTPAAPTPAAPVPAAPTPDPRIATLVAALGQPDAGARWRAAQQLGALRADAAPAVGALVSALSDRSPDVRWRSAEALGLVGPAARGAVAALARAVSDPDPLVQTEAIKALGLLGDASAEAVPTLAARLSASDVSIRREAARALARVGPGALPALQPLVAALRDKDKFVRMEAARALGRIGPPAREASPALAAAARDSELLVAREAQAALKAIGN